MGKLKLYFLTAFLIALAHTAFADSPTLICKSLFADILSLKPRQTTKAKALERDFVQWRDRVPRTDTMVIADHSIGLAIMQKSNEFYIEVRFFIDGELNSKKYGTRYKVNGQFQFWKNSKYAKETDNIIVATDRGLIQFSPFKGIVKDIPFSKLNGIGSLGHMTGFGVTTHFTKVFLGFKKMVAVVDLEHEQVVEQFDIDITSPKFGISQNGDYIIYGGASVQSGAKAGSTSVEIVDSRNENAKHFILDDTVTSITSKGNLVAYSDNLGNISIVDLSAGVKTELNTHFDYKNPLKKISSLKFKADERSRFKYYLEIKNNVGETSYEDISSLVPTLN